MKIQIPASKVMPTGSFSIYRSHTDGKTWVIPAWIEVPINTVWSDIELTGKKIEVSSINVTKHIVKGSKGNEYTVTVEGQDKASCSCVGFGYHRTCRHVKQILTNIS